MKRTVRILCAAAAALMLALPLAGCDAVKDTANQVRDGVNSTVDRVNTFELERDADTLNNAVKTFYAKVVSGELNATTAANRISAPLPPQNASVAERKARAAELTVYSVIEEQGMTSRFTEDQLASFVCCENTIRYAGSKSVEGKPCFAINYNTPLGSIING